MIPLCIGDMISRPLISSYEEVTPTVIYEDEEYMNPILSSTISDIFRKTDMALTRTLDVSEL